MTEHIDQILRRWAAWNLRHVDAGLPEVRSVNGIIASMPLMLRQCLILYYIDQRPVQECAKILGMSEAKFEDFKAAAMRRVAQRLTTIDITV